MKKLHINWVAFGLFVSSLVLIGVGYVLLRDPQMFSLCPTEAIRNCLSESLRYGWGKPLLEGISVLPIVFFILMFIPKKVFWAWSWFAVPYALVTLAIVSQAPPLGNMFSPDRVDYVRFFSYLFAGISALVVVVAYTVSRWRAKK